MKVPSRSVSPVQTAPEKITADHGSAFSTHPEPLNLQRGEKRSADSETPTNRPGDAKRADLIGAYKKMRPLVSTSSSVAELPDTVDAQALSSRISATSSASTSTSIEELNEADASAEVENFKELLKQLADKPGHVPTVRFTETRDVTEGVQKDIEKKIPIFSCKVDGRPAGFMTLDHKSFPKDPPYISHLVTHPSHRGLGGTLIEYAVNRSQELGYNGEVEISPGSEKVRKIYLSMGFEKSEFLKLTPSKNKNWTFNDGHWHFQRNYESDQV